MTTEAAPVDPSRALSLHVEHNTSLAFPSGSDLMAYKDAAAMIYRSGMFKQYPNPESVFVGVLYLRELGANLVTGLRAGFVIEGKFDVEVKIKLAGFQAKLPTFEWTPVKWDDTVCHIQGRLSKNHPWKEYSFSREEADSAGYSKDRNGGVKDNWKGSKAKEMLLWRCLTRWMNVHGAHVLYAMPTVIQVDAEEDAKHMGPVDGRAEVVEDAHAPAFDSSADQAAGTSRVETPTVSAEPVGGSESSPQAPGDSPAPATPGPPAPAKPLNYMTETIKLLEKNAYKRGSSQLRVIGLLFQKWGFVIPKNYQAITTDEWKRLYETFTSPKMDWGKVPTVGSTSGENPPSMPPQEGTPTDPAAAARARLAEILKARPDPEVWEYYPSGTGNLWVTNPQMVEACGERDSVIVEATDEKYVQLLASEALAIMLTRAVQEHYGSSEDDTQVDRPKMGARAKSQLAQARDQT